MPTSDQSSVPVRRVAGCMTGTSIDAADGALIELRGAGVSVHATFVRGLSRPLGELGGRLRALAEQAAMTAGDIGRLSREFSLLHAELVNELMGGETPEFVAVHGQTVFHSPPVSWQLLTPAVVSRALGVPVVSDLRAADLAAGGQGAPITPMADFVLFRPDARARLVCNLGGFCNVTLLPLGGGPAEVRGGDLGPCNHLLDHISRRVFGAPYDVDGRRAMRGRADERLAQGIAARLGGDGGRSLGTGDEMTSWIDERLSDGIDAADLCRAVCEAVAILVNSAPSRFGARDPVELVLAGGGTRNQVLCAAMESRWSHGDGRVLLSDALGVPVQYREASAMAVLGALAADGVPVTIPAVTRAREAGFCGCWTGLPMPARCMSKK